MDQARTCSSSDSRKGPGDIQDKVVEAWWQEQPSREFREARSARVYGDLLLWKKICILIWISQGSHVYFLLCFAILFVCFCISMCMWYVCMWARVCSGACLWRPEMATEFLGVILGEVPLLQLELNILASLAS